MNRRHRQRLQRLGLLTAQPPQTVRAWCAVIAGRRNRPITVLPVSVPLGGPSGLLVRRGDEDVIAVADDAAPLLQDHIVLHELAHLALGHEQLDHNPARTSPGGERLTQEREAEQSAEDMAEWALTPTPTDPTITTATRRHHPVWPAARARYPSVCSQCLTGPLRQSVAGTTARHVLYRQLHALWLPLTDATPRIAAPLLDPELDTQLPIRHTHAALRRRVVQIHDSLWHLRGHLNPHIYDAARRRANRYGLDEHSADIEGHAAAIAAAIRAPIAAADGQPHPHLTRHGSTDVDTDAVHLAAIAHAIRRSPVVAATIATIAHQPLATAHSLTTASPTEHR